MNDSLYGNLQALHHALTIDELLASVTTRWTSARSTVLGATCLGAEASPEVRFVNIFTSTFP